MSLGKGKGNSSVDALETEMSSQLEERKATVGVLDTSEAKRGKCIHLCQYLVLAVLVLVYFGYEVSQYLDTDTNRKSYTKDDTVHEMPLPFIYVDWGNVTFNYSTVDEECEITVYFVNNDTGLNISLASMDYTYFDIDNDLLISKVLSDTKGSEDWKLYKSKLFGTDQVLLVPGEAATVTVNSKQSLDVLLSCNTTQAEMDDIYYMVDHRDQLTQFTWLSSATDEFYFSSEYTYDGYEISMTYQWFEYDNTVDTDTSFYDYFITTIGSTFQLDNPFVRTHIRTAPNSVGKKTVFVTTQDLEVWDIFSQTGGIYSLLTDGFGLILAFLLWGNIFSCHCFKGYAPNTNPDDVEPRLSDQINREFEIRDAKLASLERTIEEMKNTRG